MTKIPTLLLLSALALPALPAQIKQFKFELETLGGQKINQDQFQNNLVIIDFWGTWCPPCRKAIPGLVELYKKYKHHGLEIIGLNYRERGDAATVKKTIRDFATEYGITYTLAVGTKEVQKQILGFSGYPTMVFFNKGMKFDHLEVGFQDSHLKDMEAWIQKQLGIGGDGASEGADPEKGAKPAPGKATAKKTKKPKKVKVPAGVIWKPGTNDTGFDFTVKTLDGGERKFKDYAGKHVILVLTSTWDFEAANTAATIQELHKTYHGDKVAVVAASLEQKRDHKSRVAAIRKFAAAHETSYEILPVGLDVLKKIFQPSGVPMFLVFDGDGKLILRQKANTKERILKAIAQVLK